MFFKNILEDIAIQEHMSRIPALFVGHGSPFNLFEQNTFTISLQNFGKTLFQKYHPEAIVIISAHWMTDGTYVITSEHPKMVYDYYNFPQKFYEYVYPAKGSPKFASKIHDFLPNIVKTTTEWGIDHAATIVLENLIPSGEIPVIELSLDIRKPPEYHLELGKKLEGLREENILFIGSGNLIHTFREMKYELDSEPFPWALKLDQIQKEAIDSYALSSLLDFRKISLEGRGFQTYEHYLPLLYILGMKQKNEEIQYLYEGIQHGSISHRSLIIE